MSTRPKRASGKRKAEEPAQAPAAAQEPAQKKGGKKKKQQETEEPETCHDIFMREIAEREKQLQKHCIVMEMVDTDEDETTLEQLRALKRVFVPEQVQDDFIEIWSELDEVGQDESGDEGEEADDADATMKAFMMMFMGKCLTTKHAAEMQTILEGHLDFIDESIKSQSWQAAFCRWVATVMAARREPHWWEDTDVPDDALDVYERLRGHWLQLKDKSDEELGGLVCEIPGLTVKDELAQYFQGLADEMKQLDYEVVDLIGEEPKPKKQKKTKSAKPGKGNKAETSEPKAKEAAAAEKQVQTAAEQGAKKQGSKNKAKKPAVGEQQEEQQVAKKQGSKKRGAKAAAEEQQQQQQAEVEHQQEEGVKAKSSKQTKKQKGKSAAAAEVPIAKKQKVNKGVQKDKAAASKGAKAK